MNRYWLAVLLCCAVSLHASAQSGPPRPSEDAARKALASRIDQGSTRRLSLGKFEKVDGRTTTGADGVTRYTMFIDAEVAVHDKVAVKTGISAVGTNYPIDEIRVEAPVKGDVFSQINAASDTVRSVCQGQRLKLRGILVWELFESGWRHNHAELKLAIEPQGIDCNATGTVSADRTDQAAGTTAAESALVRDLKSAVRSRAKCDDLGELRNLKRIEVGQYAANARPYYTYAFEVQMRCKPGAPFYAFRGRVDYSGQVRFVVQVDPQP
jgi:hypothetical protein